MFFLLKSIFWLSLVVWAMPDGPAGEFGAATRQARSLAQSPAARMVQDACLARPGDCAALAGAAAASALPAARPKAAATQPAPAAPKQTQAPKS